MQKTASRNQARESAACPPERKDSRSAPWPRRSFRRWIDFRNGLPQCAPVVRASARSVRVRWRPRFRRGEPVPARDASVRPWVRLVPWQAERDALWYALPDVVVSVLRTGRVPKIVDVSYRPSRNPGPQAVEACRSVASEAGGLVACPGGSLRLPDGREAIKALTWADVADIVEQFSSLNPYDREVVPGSVLKIEDDNFDPETRRQRQLYCYAISSKRYALFVLDSKGTPTLTKWSEHGLGHLCNPTDLDSDDRRWIPQVWLNIVRRALKLRTRQLSFEYSPAIGRVTISSPAVIRPLAALNDGKTYGKQLKPFNFLLTCHVRVFGHPSDVDPERFHLIAPYESDPERWTDIEWIDQYSGKPYRITTEGHHGGRGVPGSSARLLA